MFIFQKKRHIYLMNPCIGKGFTINIMFNQLALFVAMSSMINYNKTSATQPRKWMEKNFSLCPPGPQSITSCGTSDHRHSVSSLSGQLDPYPANKPPSNHRSHTLPSSSVPTNL